MLLRKMMAQYVLKELVERKKQGLSAPDASWFCGDGIGYVRRSLLIWSRLSLDNRLETFTATKPATGNETSARRGQTPRARSKSSFRRSAARSWPNWRDGPKRMKH